MLLFIISFLGGVLTIVSPCVLPVLPFVFARADRPFVASTLPILGGMALTFAGVATLASVGGSWVAQFNQVGRIVALIVLVLFAITLISRTASAFLMRPVVAMGNRLVAGRETARTGITGSVLLGIATGLLWAPCAGPILGLVLTGAAISGANLRTSLLLLSYAAGAACSLGLAIAVGGRVFAAMKRSLGVGEWVRRALGVAVLCGVVAIAFGWDRGALTRVSSPQTSRLEQVLIGKLAPQMMPGASSPSGTEFMPSLDGASQWLNSPPLSAANLRGNVVVVDFWTYSCINCLRTLPYVKRWYDRYHDHGLVVIGVHTPEFPFERDPGNVKRAIADYAISYPVAMDNGYRIWRAFHNQYWPAHSFIDAGGRIRGHHFGEGDYAQSEQLIRQLLLEAGHTDLPELGVRPPMAAGVLAPAARISGITPETYLGAARAARYLAHASDSPASLAMNQWTLRGEWNRTPEKIGLAGSPGSIVFRFRARDVHLVMGASVDGASVPFTVLLDGKPPGESHGSDVDATGHGMLQEHRLYQIIRLSGGSDDHTVEIRFPGGVDAYAFTFG